MALAVIEKLIPLKFPPGLYRNGTKYQAKGRWYDANLVRFYEGSIRPIQGWRVAQDDNSEGLAPLAGVPRAAIGWRSAVGLPLLAVGTTAGLFVVKQGVVYDITPADFVAGDENAGSGGNGDFGFSIFGRGLFGVGKAALAASLTDADTWQLDAFGDVLVACPTSGGRIYVWTGNTAAIAEPATDSPEPNRGVVITPERFVVAIGANDDVRLVAWASQATTDDWTASDVNTAGDFTLTSNGRAICARRTKAQTLIWTDADLHSMTYVGGDVVYSFKQEGDNCGIVSAQGVAILDSTAVWMGRDNFFGYDGFVKPIPCDVHDYVFGDFNSQQASKVFAYTVSEFSEVWWFYPSAGSAENDRYVIYNYREQHWTTGTLGRTAAVDRGALPNPVAFDASGNIYEHEISAGTHETPVTTIISDTLTDVNDTTLQAHTPGGSPVVFAWDHAAGSGLSFTGNRVVNGTPLIGLTLDSFQGAGPTYLDAHTADIGQGYVLVDGTASASFLQISGNKVVFANDSDFPMLLTLDYQIADTHTPAFLEVAFAAGNVTMTTAGHGAILRICASKTGKEALEIRAHLKFGDYTKILVEIWQVIADGSAGLLATSAELDVAAGVPFTIGGGKDAANLVTAYYNGVAVATITDAVTVPTRYVGLASQGTGTPVVAWEYTRLSAGAGVQPALYLADETLDDDYMVSTVAPLTSTGAFRGVAARASAVGYRGYYFGVAAGVAQLFGLDAAGVDLFTPIVADVDPALLDTDGVISLKVEGSALNGYIGGVLACSKTDATYATGRAGVYGGGADEPSFKGVFSVLTIAQAAIREVVDAIAGGSTSVALTPFLESGPMEIEDGDRVARVQRVVPDEKNLGDVRMRFFTALFPTDAETERGPYTSQAPTSVRFTARQVRLRIEQVVATSWRLGVTRIGVILGGRR